MDQALAAEGNEFGLRLAPVAEFQRPFTRAALVEDPLTGDDHRSIKNACKDRRDVAGRNADHRLVKELHPGRGVLPLDECLSVSHQTKSWFRKS